MRWILAIFSSLTIAFLGLGYLRSESGLIHAFDTGIYLQILSNLAAGRGWMSSIVQETQFLAHHFQPVLLLLLPFHLISNSAWMLLLVGWLAALATCHLLIRELSGRGLASRTSATVAALAFFLHPTLTSRMYYSFVPEVLALPALAYLAINLASPHTRSWRENAGLIFALIFVGLCKENYWLISAWVAGLFAVQTKDRQQRMFFAGAGVCFLGLMLFLFMKWMPEHSSMKQYYGLSYFQNPAVKSDGGLTGLILGAILNIFSLASLNTALIILLVIPSALLPFGNIWTTLATLPTVGLVMAASNDQIQDLTNHYLLAALPFLAVTLATAWDRLQTKINSRKLRFYGVMLIVLIPASFTFMHHSGWIFQLLFATERTEWRLRAATLELKKKLDPDVVILIDGQLQPFFHDLPRVRVIQAFQGNPSPLDADDRAAAAHIITANDLSGLQSCDEVKSDGQELVRYDVAHFLNYCRWLKTLEYERTEYLPERLIHLKIKGIQP